VYVKKKDDWLIHSYEGVEDVISFPQLGIELPLAEIYDDVTFVKNK